MLTRKPTPDFRSAAFLREHALSTLAFYDGRCIDPSGGLFHFYKDDGQVYDACSRHLVSSTRFVITFSTAAHAFPEHPRAAAWLNTAAHAWAFLQGTHRQYGNGGYAWLLHWEQGQARLLDPTQHCYGLAFALLAHAHAARVGIAGARAAIDDTFALMEARFWEAQHGLYADEASGDWAVAPYRGQNANMHACEALLAAFEVTGDHRFLDRAMLLAESVTGRLAQQSQGLIWEHYGPDWQADWDYNRHDRSNIFRPWGFQTGHLTEWAKLLLTLERLSSAAKPCDAAPWMLERARALFSAAMTHGWDAENGGLVYGFAPKGTPDTDARMAVCDGDKYHWVQAESLAAAALLATRTGSGAYWDWYDRIWAYAWRHFVDHEHGAWFRILAPDNRRVTDEKSPAGKVDYHNLGACHEVLEALAR
jgi:mannose/cellobiose epimerase-like protein (N-acyl-D-glucosamine 2-epimerase family)